jgi:hypothetical protein
VFLCLLIFFNFFFWEVTSSMCWLWDFDGLKVTSSLIIYYCVLTSSLVRLYIGIRWWKYLSCCIPFFIIFHTSIH